MNNQQHIRNFAIIAHIDHGKSTLADRLIEMTQTVSSRGMMEQLLDSNPIERERGITIKLAPVRMLYAASGIKEQYVLNLIDTPGHVDFGYEVSRSLAACEGAVLIVDASQGIQAQTLANLKHARDQGLVIIPVMNKIDLPNARPEEVRDQIVRLGFAGDDILSISAKTGDGVAELLEQIVEKVPPPSGDPDKPLRGLVFSSTYDSHKGVVIFVRVVDGKIHYDTDTNIMFMASGAVTHPVELGHFRPKMQKEHVLHAGEVGYIATGLKDIRLAKVGDTITLGSTGGSKLQNSHHAVGSPQGTVQSATTPLPGYKEPKPMVYLGLFPINSDELADARDAMDKLRLSDSAFRFQPISSLALGNGFLCGFLGLLHAEVVQERFIREFDLSLIATAPTVEYRVKQVGQKEYGNIHSAAEFPDPSLIEDAKEPVMEVTIYAPRKFVGSVMALAQSKRGEYVDLIYQGDQAVFTYIIPLAEMIVDFFDKLKSATEGYASLDYTYLDHQSVNLVKVDILVNHEPVDAFASLSVRQQAEHNGRQIVERLSLAIPRQQFEVPIQAAIGGKIIARSNVKAFRKDVTAKLYGGDRTRKDKLLKKQKKGKARMKMVGRVEIPQSAFFTVLKRE